MLNFQIYQKLLYFLRNLFHRSGGNDENRKLRFSHVDDNIHTIDKSNTIGRSVEDVNLVVTAIETRISGIGEVGGGSSIDN